MSDSFAVGGAAGDSLVVLRSGNVGIGDTAPGAKLRVAGDVSVSDSLVVGDTRLVVLKSGNVGIGTTAPGQVLDVRSSGTNGVAKIQVGNSDVSQFLQLYPGRSGQQQAEIVWTNTGPLIFYNASDVTHTGLSEKMRIQSGGNVGIGTSSPSDSLHVAGTVRVSDSMTVGDTVFVVNSKSGNVGIGTTSPGAKLHVAGNVIVKDTMTVGDTFLVVLASGRVGIGTASPDTTFSVNGEASKVGGGTWNTFSDGRLKDIDGEFRGGSDELMKLHTIRYRYKAQNPAGITDRAEHVGLVAQEVQQVLPEAVYSNNQGFLMLKSDPIIFAMLNAVKEQKVQNDELKQRMQEQQAQIETLTKKVEALQGAR